MPSFIDSMPSAITAPSIHPPETEPIISPLLSIAICPPTGLGALPHVEITVARETFLFSFNQTLVGVKISSISFIILTYKI